MNVQRLTHGKALCGKVFGSFVETFNALVNFFTNVKGDADVNPEVGHITVDRKDPSNPIIRCEGCGEASGGEYQDVVTDVSLELEEDEETGNKKLVLKKTVKSVKVIEAAPSSASGAEGEEDDSVEASSIELKEVDAVVGSTYDETDHTFVHQTKKMTVLEAAEEEEDMEEPVFTAVAHSENA